MTLFIVLDGMDGSGKGEMIQRLHNYLFKTLRDVRIITTREPTGGQFGKKIRERLTHDHDPRNHADELFDLFIQDRKDHVETLLKPYLKEKSSTIILCDRYYYSTYAFQQTQGIPFEIIHDANKDFPSPTIAFLLDLPVSEALRRVSGRGVTEKFEKKEFMEELRKNFLELPNKLSDKIIVIDASQSPSEVFSALRKEVDKLLKEFNDDAL